MLAQVMRCSFLSLLLSGVSHVTADQSTSPLSPPVHSWIGSHSCMVFNTEAQHVVVLFHGLMTSVEKYYPLALKFADLGYAVVMPDDCMGLDCLAAAASWGTDVSAAVRDWADGRRVGVVGHSMGGGAAMAAAKFTPGLAAYAALHPAPAVSGGAFWTRVNGPILFTTGTADDGSLAGATKPLAAFRAYQHAESPKALVNVRGDAHESSQAISGMEWMAVSHWLGCYVKQNAQQCDWLRDQLCQSNDLEWCERSGIDLVNAEGGGIFV